MDAKSNLSSIYSGKNTKRTNGGSRMTLNVPVTKIDDYDSYYDKLSEIPLSLYQSDNVS